MSKSPKISSRAYKISYNGLSSAKIRRYDRQLAIIASHNAVSDIYRIFDILYV